jgi:hypothetical protein
MKDQVVIAPSGILAIAVPLYRVHYEESLATGWDGYTVSLTKEKPLAYVVDCGKESGLMPQLMNAEVVERNLEFLGDL